jgi:hypothetical protein
LTYRVVEEPRFGELTGTPPTLTYTPMANYVGVDRFSFVVNNGVMDSNPADVSITITPDGDSTAPTVLWSSPERDEVVVASYTPFFADETQELFAPALVVAFSEPLDPSTLNAESVSLSGGIGLQVLYDPSGWRLIAYPTMPLADGVYTVVLDTAVADLAGNPLATPYSFSFTVGAGSTDQHIYLPLITR